jgi:hypothetical protein
MKKDKLKNNLQMKIVAGVAHSPRFSYNLKFKKRNKNLVYNFLEQKLRKYA